jgi:hypothetical protein
MVKNTCIEDSCKQQALYNYKNEAGYRYCKNHIKTRLIDTFLDYKIQRMSNKSKNTCNVNLCPKDLSKESKILCAFHYKLKLFNLENLLTINNIKDLDKLKKQYESRLEQFKNLQHIEDIKKFTANHITKYKLQGLKNIDYIEELEEFKDIKIKELEYLNTVTFENLVELKENWNSEYKELTGENKNIEVKGSKEIKNSNPKCIIKDCKISANYNKKGLNAIYCSEHAKEIGIGNTENQLRNVRTKLCEHIFEDGLDCIKIALYGIDTKQFCKDHVEEGMYKLSKDKKCKKEDCVFVPSYGFENGISEYCKKHAEKGMKQLYQKCIIDGCKERARYNVDGKKGLRYCLLHKTKDMKDNTKKICIEDKCSEEAYYNVKHNNNGIYCNLHKKENMCSNKNKTCKYEDCLIDAYFGTKEDPRQYCSSHKEIFMYDYTSKTCSNCNLYQVRKNPNLCSYCNPNKYKKTKEMKVINYLNKNNIQFIHNKSIGYLCGNFKPDILIDCNTHFIIVEVDEGQHRQYTKECEFARMSNIYLANGLPTIFIRFNPDNFKVNNIRNQTKIETRLNKLLKIIKEYQNKENINFIELLYLYFDCPCENKCNFIHVKEFVLS